MKNILIVLLLALNFIGIHLLSHAQSPSSDDAPVSELYALIIELDADRGSLSRFYGIPYSPERRERMKGFYQGYLDRLAVYDYRSLSTGGKVDYILTERLIKEVLATLDLKEERYKQLKDWVVFGEPLYGLEKLRRRGKQMDGMKVAGQLTEISQQIQGVSKKLARERKTFSREVARAGGAIIQGQLSALESVYRFYKGYDPQFSWWVTKPRDQLVSVLQHYEQQLRASIDSTTLPQDDGSGIVGNPIGREALLRQLQHEFIPYSPEELVALAEKEFAWCDAELLKASNEMGFGDDWKAAQEKVKQAYVPVGQQPEAMLQLYNESVAFLKENDLISIPPIAEETWRMSMLSPKQQLYSPFFLGGEVLQIAYPTDEMEHADKLMSMRGNNPHFSRATVHHELIAGHHLQGFMNDRHKTYRRKLGRTPFWTEGWALYWEILLWEKGFPQSPEDKIGMLFWRSHRCARIIFSLNYHLGKWTPQQCIDFLVDRVGHERANAAAEVRRSFTGGYGPLYQIAYMLGGLQFYALKEELVESGKMSFKEFHDAVMRENNMPIELLRYILTNEGPKRAVKSSWEFYGKVE